MAADAQANSQDTFTLAAAVVPPPGPGAAGSSPPSPTAERD
jgi:hypothetical protein